MFPKNTASKYVSGLAYTLKLQWKASGWLSVALVATNIIQGISQIGSSYLNALIIAQFPLLIMGSSTVEFALLVVAARIIYQFAINGIYAANNYFENKVSNSMRLDVEEAIINKLYSLGQDQLESAEYNPTITRVNEDSYLISSIARNLSHFIGEIFGFFGAIASLLFLEPILGLVVLIMAVPLARLELRQTKLRRDSYKKTESHIRIGHSLSWYMKDSEFLSEIRLSNNLAYLIQIYTRHKKIVNKESEIIELKALKAKIINDFTQLVVLLGSDIWLVFKAAAAEMTLESLLFARNLIQAAVNSSGSIARSTRDLSEGIVYLGDLQTFFEFPTSIPNGSKILDASKGISIEFKNVHFSYPDSDKEVIRGVSFVLSQNEKIAIVGLNGAGKSTLLKLALGEYPPSSGTILVNSTPINEYGRTSYTENISVLMQNYMIVNPITIGENLRIGQSSATNDQILSALDDVEMRETVENLKFGLESRVNPFFKDGTQLSGGQKQKLAIARSLLKNSRLMILDEPTSAIDARSEAAIFERILSRKKQSTIIISHRFSTVREADKIIVLDEGVISEEGSHEELMSNKGLYHELFTKQAKGYK